MRRRVSGSPRPEDDNPFFKYAVIGMTQEKYLLHGKRIKTQEHREAVARVLEEILVAIGVHEFGSVLWELRTPWDGTNEAIQDAADILRKNGAELESEDSEIPWETVPDSFVTLCRKLTERLWAWSDDHAYFSVFDSSVTGQPSSNRKDKTNMAVITKLRTTAEIQPILQRILSGEPLRPIAADSGVSRSTLFQWKRAVDQAKVAGEDPMKAVVSGIQ